MAKIYKEKECEVCGVWFTPHTANTKYCPACRVHSDQKRKSLAHQTARSIRMYGTGRKPEKISCTCRYCGKIFSTYGRERDYCSNTCASKHRISLTTCAYCQKPMLETDDIRDMMGKPWFCSEVCREKAEWHYARISGKVKTCPNCGKEFITKNTYCSKACYLEYIRKKSVHIKSLKEAGLKECPVCGKEFSGKSRFCSSECEQKYLDMEPHAMRKCEVCGKMFSCPASEMLHPLCSNTCKEKFESSKKETKILQNKKSPIQPKHKNDKYIEENGLCSICKTSYKDCERMRSNYTASPEGSVFQGSIVVKCPKFR